MWTLNRRQRPVVRQYSDGRAKPTANSRIKRNVGLPTTRSHTELRLTTAFGTYAQMVSHCRRSQRHGLRARNNAGATAARLVATVDAAGGHGRYCWALLYGPDGDCGRDARGGTTAGANAPNRRSSCEWRRSTNRFTEPDEPTSRRRRRGCAGRAHPHRRDKRLASEVVRQECTPGL